MGQVRSDPLNEVHFVCRSCGHKFSSSPGRTEEASDRHHPWLYFHDCSECGAEAAQAGWEMGLMATYGRHTGPKTEEGKAASAANLAGHPTPEEAKRTRFNAMKHGMRSRVATFHPAKPGSYPHCDGCEHRESEDCRDYGACLKRTELFMKFHTAFELGDPGVLRELFSDTQANVFGLINDMMLAIAQDGVRQKTPAWFYDKDGSFNLAQWTDDDNKKHQIYELTQHPNLKTLMEFIAKNSATLADMNMTPRVQQDNETLKGYLETEGVDKETAIEAQQRQANALEDMRDMIARSQTRIKTDSVLMEHRGEEAANGG